MKLEGSEMGCNSLVIKSDMELSGERLSKYKKAK